VFAPPAIVVDPVGGVAVVLTGRETVGGEGVDVLTGGETVGKDGVEIEGVEVVRQEIVNRQSDAWERAVTGTSKALPKPPSASAISNAATRASRRPPRRPQRAFPRVVAARSGF
jgi:hypothetical protein